MPQEYTDYIQAAQSRIEREKQLTAKYDQQPEPIRQQGLWMHSIERHENPQDLVLLFKVLFFVAITVIALGFYLA